MEDFYGTLRSLWLLWLLLLFLGIVAWAFWPGRRRRQQMREHAEIPLRDEPGATAGDAPRPRRERAQKED